MYNPAQGGGGGVATFDGRSGAVVLGKPDVTATGLAAADVGAAALAHTHAEADVTNLPGDLSSRAVLLSRTVLAAPAVNFDVTGISQAFENLIVRIAARTDNAVIDDVCLLRANNDTSQANYSTVYVDGQSINLGGAVTPTGNNPLISGVRMDFPGANAAAGAAGHAALQIPKYARTVFRKHLFGNVSGTLTADDAGAPAASGQIRMLTGIWKSTAAINRLTLFSTNGGHFITGSVFEIYAEP